MAWWHGTDRRITSRQRDIWDWPTDAIVVTIFESCMRLLIQMYLLSIIPLTHSIQTILNFGFFQRLWPNLCGTVCVASFVTCNIFYFCALRGQWSICPSLHVCSADHSGRTCFHGSWKFQGIKRYTCFNLRKWVKFQLEVDLKQFWQMI